MHTIPRIIVRLRSSERLDYASRPKIDASQSFDKYNDAADINDARNQSKQSGQQWSIHLRCTHPASQIRPLLTSPRQTSSSQKYDGTTNPAIWISNYILAVQVANDNDFHAVKHLPLMLKVSARAWLHTLQPLLDQELVGFTSRVHGEFPGNIYQTRGRSRPGHPMTGNRRVSKQLLDSLP